MATALTSLSHGAGCGCKLPAAAVHGLVRELPAPSDPRVLVGHAGADDAAVVRLTDTLAVVSTADFFTPIVDDPALFGRIAATNALSDVYAMGGEPVCALNLVAFPLETLGEQTLRAILAGGGGAVAEAGASIVGGHSIDDPEPKYGLAVTGTVHPDEVLTNAGGRPGDALVLTKPLGTGAITTAAKRGAAGVELDAAIAAMCELNRDAARAARAAGAHALTDVTGFGLLGHLHELARASGVAAEVEAAAVPALAGADALLADGVGVSRGLRGNLEYAETFSSGARQRPLLGDPMTSGGLLVAVAPSRAGEVPGVVVGRLVAGPAGRVAVV